MMTNGTIQSAVKKAAVAVSEGDLDGAKENVELAAKQATRELDKARKVVTKAAGKVEEAALERPVVTAGVLLGVGALVGAAVHKLLNPPPTAGQVLLQALKRGGVQAGDTLFSGVHRAKRALS